MPFVRSLLAHEGSLRGDDPVKPLTQVLAENGHEPPFVLAVPGIVLASEPFAQTKLTASVIDAARTPVSVHASRQGEWLATLRLEDLLAMIPDGYGRPEAEPC
jgi:hypothetical protein